VGVECDDGPPQARRNHLANNRVVTFRRVESASSGVKRLSQPLDQT
jgi:hypothetical protein